MSYPFGRNVLLSSVGFDRLIDAMEEMNAGEAVNKAQSYPPYNIIKKMSGTMRLSLLWRALKTMKLILLLKAIS